MNHLTGLEGLSRDTTSQARIKLLGAVEQAKSSCIWRNLLGEIAYRRHRKLHRSLIETENKNEDFADPLKASQDPGSATAKNYCQTPIRLDIHLRLYYNGNTAFTRTG